MNERPHTRLIVWNKALQLVEEIYASTSVFPRGELYSLTNQMRRAAVSVPSNIAEGSARWSKNDKLHFFRMARSSLSEIETQIEISRRLAYLTLSRVEALFLLSNEVGRLLNGLILSRERQSE